MGFNHWSFKDAEAKGQHRGMRERDHLCTLRYQPIALFDEIRPIPLCLAN